MLILNGNNLGERQKELNIKVKEAVTSKIDFEQIKDKTEQSDVDKLFKIDLASKYKDIDYIIEVFKSGDSLHISRALKCTWIFDDEFSHIINVDNLQHNIFPFMSLKMKKKLLFTISTHVRNEERAASFYNYCLAVRMENIAQQFAIFTSEDFKLDLIQKNVRMMRDRNTKHFIGHSFTLAKALVATDIWERSKLAVFKEISYLYSVSDEKYLDMLEDQVSEYDNYSARLGLRISKDIITKHKNRVLAKPDLYINLLNQNCIVRHSSAENAKIYAIALLPNDVYEFWNSNFCSTYEFILNILPHEDRFEFIKKIFLDKYPDQQFEMTSEFHSLDYCRFMTKEQKEKWALDHIASQKEILSIGNDYKWYKYISFEIAFDAIKKLVMITPDSNKRSEMLHILLESAKSQRELEKLFKYYYERHNNELQHIRENFMAEAASIHNVFEFDKDCWNTFNKIYENLYVYSLLESSRNEFRAIALIYHVINKLDVHEALKLYIDNEISFYTMKQNTDRLPKEKQELVYQYLFLFFMAKINDFDSVPYCDDTKYNIREYIYNMLDLLHNYDRSKKDLPEVVMKYIKLDWDEFKCHELLDEGPTKSQKKTTQEDLIRLLKKDAKLLVENLPLVKQTIENSYTFHLGQLLKKLKVYFLNDIAKECLKFYSEILTSPQLNSKVARAACYGIFQLAEDKFQVDFMTKHAPTQSKINRGEMNESLLNIQEAICATAFYSRPPVPLKTMFLYVKGDYVPFCLPMFNSYLANLPFPLCMDFIECLLNNPLSIQKHGIRFAFTRFNAENLRNLVLQVWKKTKNVSLRRIIYKALYDKIKHEDQSAQTILFETLRKLTLELKQDDDQEIFALIILMKVPVRFKSDYIDAAWRTVSTLENNNINLERKADVISCMISNIQSIQPSIIQRIVEKFVREDINTEELFKTSLEPNRLYENKWELVAYFIMYVNNTGDLQIRLEMTKLILKYCLRSYNLVVDNQYKIRKFTAYFIRKLLKLSFSKKLDTYQYVNEIFETALQTLLDKLSVKNIYMIIWAVRLNILARNAIFDINCRISESKDDSDKLALFKDEILKFGTQLGLLISDYISKNMYLKIFLPNIEREILENVRRMYSAIPGFIINANTNDLLVVTSVALMKFKATEISLFALNILPMSCQNFEQDYISVLNELKDIEDLEISCKMYDKYVDSDYVPRAFLQL